MNIYSFDQNSLIKLSSYFKKYNFTVTHKIEKHRKLTITCPKHYQQPNIKLFILEIMSENGYILQSKDQDEWIFISKGSKGGKDSNIINNNNNKNDILSHEGNTNHPPPPEYSPNDQTTLKH